MYFSHILENAKIILEIAFQMETLTNPYLSDEYKKKRDDTLKDIETTLQTLKERLSVNLYHSPDKL